MMLPPTDHTKFFRLSRRATPLAMPGMADERFARSVIYLCAHSAEGAMGIVLNRPAADRELAGSSGAARDHSGDQSASGCRRRSTPMQVLMGGPVETSRGFVLHSPDFHIAQSTLPIDDSVCLTATIDILRAHRARRGPEGAMLALGYAGWSAGQLENEIQANGWLNCPADAELDLQHSGRRCATRWPCAGSASSPPCCPWKPATPEEVDQAASGAAPDELARLQHRHGLAEDRALRVFAAELVELDRFRLASPRPPPRSPCRVRAPS